MRVFDRIGGTKVQVVGNGSDFFSWNVIIGNTSWEIYECSIGCADELEKLLTVNRDLQSRL